MIEAFLRDLEKIFASPQLLAANAVSVIAAICMVFSCIFKKRKTVFLLQGAQCGLLCITQLILGMYGGLITLFIGALRNILTAYDKIGIKLTFVFAALIGVLGTAVNFSSEGGLIGILPVVATVIYTFGCYYIKKPNLMRVNILVNTLLWIGYSLTVFDFVTAFTDMTVAAVDTVALLVVAVKNKSFG